MDDIARMWQRAVRWCAITLTHEAQQALEVLSAVGMHLLCVEYEHSLALSAHSAHSVTTEGRCTPHPAPRRAEDHHYARHCAEMAALGTIGILHGCNGVSLHDGWTSYRHYRACRHTCATPTTCGS